MSFCVQFLSFSTLFLRCTHVVACITVSTLLWSNNVTLYEYTTLFIHSFDDGHLSCFYFLVIVNSEAVNICVQVFEYLFFFFWAYTWNGITGSYGNSVYNILRSHQTVSVALAPFYILPSHVRRVPVSPYSHQPLLSYFVWFGLVWFYYCHPCRCEVVLHCGFDLHFPND